MLGDLYMVSIRRCSGCNRRGAEINQHRCVGHRSDHGIEALERRADRSRRDSGKHADDERVTPDISVDIGNYLLEVLWLYA